MARCWIISGLLMTVLVLSMTQCNAFSLRVGDKKVDVTYTSDVWEQRRLNSIGHGCNPCALGEYVVQACAGGNDLQPTCATCSGACPAGQELVEPCGAANDRICAPKEHVECARKAVTLDRGSLFAITEDHCDNCDSHLPHINTALHEGYMACPLRLSAFIAQTRHATDGFRVMVKTGFNTVAGAIHLQPSNFRLACKQIPSVKAAFQAQFASCALDNKCDCGTDSEAANIIAQSQYAFKAGVWWFATGASQVLESPCGDLRLDADYGLGGSPFWTTRESPGIGFQKTTTCIAGFGEDPGRQQRATYYAAARSFFPDQDPDISTLFSAGPGKPVLSLAVMLLFTALLLVSSTTAAFR